MRSTRSRTTTTRRAAMWRRASRGMTLVEVLIVLAISALLIGGVATGLGAGRQAEVSRATNQLANTVRFAFNKARVTGTYYRLLINIDEGAFSMQRGDNRMYLPATDRYGRIRVVDPTKEKERDERDKRAEENYNRSLQGRILAAVDGPAIGKSAAMAKPIGQAPGAPPPAAAPAKNNMFAPPAKAGAAPTKAPAGPIDQYAPEAK